MPKLTKSDENLQSNSVFTPFKELFSAYLFTFAWLIFYWQCDELWKKTFQKGSRYSESDESVYENPSNFRFAKKLSDSDIQIWIRTLTHP